MKQDEFGFFNRQLAEMLRTGIPLEGALRQLCANMQHGRLRTEMEALGADLAEGLPLTDALAKRRLPELYVHLVQLGAKGENLPEMLTQLADHYQRRQSLWTRLQGLMVYPMIVLAAALAISGLLLWLQNGVTDAMLQDLLGEDRMANSISMFLWLPISWLATAAILLTLCLVLPSWRTWLSWKLPGFKETNIAQFASAMRLLLERGGQLNQALPLLSDLEGKSPLGSDLESWQRRLAAGEGRFADFARDSKALPPLFLWLVEQAGDDLAGGFRKAADIYYHRARQRAETMLYAALPVSVLVLGLLVLAQLQFVMQPILTVLNALGA